MADVVGKTIFSDGKGKLFFGYYKTDDGVQFVDYKTWKKLSFKDVSKGDTNKERVIKAILKGQKQFNKKVEFNMWAKQKKRTFEETIDWFIQNGWISNINKGGIKESVNEGIGTIALGVAGGLILLKVLKFVLKKVVGAVGMNVKLPKEQLLEVVKKTMEAALTKISSSGVNIVDIITLQSYLKDEINAGRITTIKQIVQIVDKVSKKGKNESEVTEAKSFKFTINYNTGDDDKAYVEEVLRARGVRATVEYGTLEDDIIIKTKNAAELRKAKKVIKADGFKINESAVNEIQYKDAVAKFNDELIKHPMVKKAAQHYKKTPAEIVKVLQQRLSTKGNRGGDTKEVSINFKDTDSGINVKHKKSFNESVNERYTGNSGDKLKHKYDKNIEIELIEPTNKGWKVYQTDKGNKRKIAYFDKQDIVGNKSLFESVNEAKVTKKDFDKVVKVLDKSKHPLTVMFVPKWDDIDILVGKYAPDNIADDVSQLLSKAGLKSGGSSGISIAGDSSSYSRREYELIKRINGGIKESVNEAKFGYTDSTSSYINKHNNEYKIAKRMNRGNEQKFYDDLQAMEDKIGYPKTMKFISNALRGYKVDMFKDPKIKNPADAQEALFLLSK